MSSSMHSGSSSGSRLQGAAEGGGGRERQNPEWATVPSTAGGHGAGPAAAAGMYLRMSLQYSSAVRGQPRLSRKLICL